MKRRSTQGLGIFSMSAGKMVAADGTLTSPALSGGKFSR